MTAQTLQRKLKTSQSQLTEVHAIRLHRAISWIKAAEEQEKNQREALHGEQVNRPWAEVIDERGIVRNVGDEGKIGFQNRIDQ